MKIFYCRYVLLCSFFLFSGKPFCFAQMPDCSTIYIMATDYTVAGDSSILYNLDPQQPVSLTNPSPNTIVFPTTPPLGANGIAVSDNLNSQAAPSPTFYTVVNGVFYYYDGSVWVNTGDSTGGGLDAVNIGAGGGYIYSFDWLNFSKVFRYDGSGNATQVLSVVPNWNHDGPADIAVDCEGNFYLVRSEPPAWLRRYSPTGVMLQQWDISGIPAQTPGNWLGGGLVILDSTLIFDVNNEPVIGTVHPDSTTITVTPDSLLPFGIGYNDMGSCATHLFAHNGTSSAYDTLFTCSDTGVHINAPAGSTYSYTLDSGTATVVGSGTGYTVRATTLSLFVLHAQLATFCDTNYITDSFLVYPLPSAIINQQICDGQSYNFYGRALLVSGRYDTVAHSPGMCDSAITLNLTVNPLPDVRAGTSDTASICIGGHATFSLISATDSTTYQWSVDGNQIPGSTGTAITVDSSGLYTITTTSARGCQDTLAFTAILYPEAAPVAVINPLGATADFCDGDSLSLFAQTGADYHYAWSPATSFPIGNNADTVGSAFSDTVDVKLVVTNQYGCQDSTTLLVQPKPCYTIFVPDAFTPNHDNLNDVFRPVFKGDPINISSFRIVNRWGALVFDGTGAYAEKGWDGTVNGLPADMGVYFYYLQLQTSSGKIINKKGDVTLIR